MRYRTAKKIARRLEHNPEAAINYSFGQLKAAFGGQIPEDVWQARERVKLRRQDDRLAEIERIAENRERKAERAAKVAARAASRRKEAQDRAAQMEQTTQDIQAAVRAEEAPELDPETLAKVAEGMQELPKLQAMSVTELKALCKDRKIKGYSKLKKAELIEALLPE